MRHLLVSLFILILVQVAEEAEAEYFEKPLSGPLLRGRGSAYPGDKSHVLCFFSFWRNDRQQRHHLEFLISMIAVQP